MRFTLSLMSFSFIALALIDLSKAGVISIEKRQEIPPMFMRLIIQRISQDFSTTIAKYAAVKVAGAEFPTKKELSNVIQKAMKSAEADDQIAISKAVKSAIDGLADEKLATAGGSKAKLQSRQEATASTASTDKEAVAPKAPKADDIDKFSASFLETVTAFANAKVAGGDLPTPDEIAQVFQSTLQNADPNNKRATALAIHKGLLDLAAQKLKAAKSGGEAQAQAA